MNMIDRPKYRTRFATDQSKGNVILIELVIVILFFALTAATAMQMFVGSHQKAQKSVHIQEASIYAQDWAEQLIDEYDPEAYLLSNGFAADDGVFRLRVEPYMIAVEVSVAESGAGRLHESTVSVFDLRINGGVLSDKSEPLTVLEVCTYEPDLEVAI